MEISHLIEKTVEWFRAPNENTCTKVARSALAIFLALALTLTGIGIIPTVWGAYVWHKQETQDSRVIPNPALAPPPPPPEAPEIPVLEAVKGPVGQADLDLTQFNSYKFSTVDEAEILAKQAQIVAVNPRNEIVRLEDLKRDGLLPTNKIVLGEVNIYSSEIFMLGTHYAAIALVEIGNQVFPRLLYHSNSQGTWRVMPSASKQLPEELRWVPIPPEMGHYRDLFHYGKGQCETDTQLPIPLICALTNLSYANAGVKNYEKAGNIVETVQLQNTPAFHKEVDFKDSMFLEPGAPNYFMQRGMRIPKPPEPKAIHMPTDPELHPDFSSPLAQMHRTLPFYDEVQVKIFPSRDKTLLYMFYETKDGKAFLASIECIKGVGINSYGVREAIIHIENMDAPLLEYPRQIAPGYAPQNRVEDHYIRNQYENNWNFVRELEIIQAYYTAQGRPLPEKV